MSADASNQQQENNQMEATLEAPTSADTEFVTLDFWSRRWNTHVDTLMRHAAIDPNYPKIRRFGRRTLRVSLEEIERYERKFSLGEQP